MLKESAPPVENQGTKQPVHQTVYQALRDMVLFGDLAPGQAVTIQGLTEELAAGMTPVREAIRRLTSEGALQSLGNRRVIVPELSLEGVEELDFMRQSLEPHLARRAALRLNDATLAQLVALDTRLNDAIDRGDIHDYLTLNYRFHRVVYLRADAPITAATIDRLWLHFGPSLRVICGRHGTLNLPDKHAELVLALRAGDADGAKRAMAEDVAQGMDQIRQSLLRDGARARFD